jgi:hypothetical protein
VRPIASGCYNKMDLLLWLMKYRNALNIASLQKEDLVGPRSLDKNHHLNSVGAGPTNDARSIRSLSTAR